MVVPVVVPVPVDVVPLVDPVEPDVPDPELPDVLPDVDPPDVGVPDVDVPDVELPELAPEEPPELLEPEPLDDGGSGVRARMNVSIRVLQPNAVSEPRLPSQGLENNAHLPSLEICAKLSP